MSIAWCTLFLQAESGLPALSGSCLLGLTSEQVRDTVRPCASPSFCNGPQGDMQTRSNLLSLITVTQNLLFLIATDKPSSTEVFEAAGRAKGPEYRFAKGIQDRSQAKRDPLSALFSADL